MIRITKSTTIPPSLQVPNPITHNNRDVHDSLIRDQHNKCYLCEQKAHKNFEVEHLIAQTVNPNLIYEWTNLFLACTYCNKRKSAGYDILEPTSNNIEDMIEQRIDWPNNLIRFQSVHNRTPHVDSTVLLLQKLFNGKNNIRDAKKQILYDDLKREINSFLQMLVDFKGSNSAPDKQKVIDSLLIHKEFLAFKYWIIKDTPDLYQEFSQYMIWNRPVPVS